MLLVGGVDQILTWRSDVQTGRGQQDLILDVAPMLVLAQFRGRRLRVARLLFCKNFAHGAEIVQCVAEAAGNAIAILCE